MQKKYNAFFILVSKPQVVLIMHMSLTAWLRWVTSRNLEEITLGII